MISALAKINSRGEFHEAPGLTAFGLFPILIIMNPSPGFRRAGGAPTFLPACFATPGLVQSPALLCFSLTCRAPTLRTSGISHASRAFSLSARRGGPCKAVGGKLWQGVTRPGEAAILFSSHTIESKLSYGVATKQNQHRFRDADSL